MNRTTYDTILVVLHKMKESLIEFFFCFKVGSHVV